MAKNGFTCSIRALFAFNGTKVFGAALGPYQMAQRLGPRACVVWNPYGGPRVHRFYAMLAHSEDRDRSGILYLEAAGSLGMTMFPPRSTFPLPSSRREEEEEEEEEEEKEVLSFAELKSRRFILSLRDPSLFKDGHYVVIWPPQDVKDVDVLRPQVSSARAAVKRKKKERASSLHRDNDKDDDDDAETHEEEEEEVVPPPPLWALLDPWRVDGKAVAVNEKQLDLLLAGTDHVIFLR
jgi:hypothetical protein